MSLWGPFFRTAHSIHWPKLAHSYVRVQNTVSPTSKVQRLFWDPRQSLICNPLLIQGTFTHFQHTVVRHVHYHSKRKERDHSEEKADQSKTENQQSKLYTPHFHVWCQSSLQTSSSFQLCGPQRKSASELCTCQGHGPALTAHTVCLFSVPYKIKVSRTTSFISTNMVRSQKSIYGYKL